LYRDQKVSAFIEIEFPLNRLSLIVVKKIL